MRARVIVITGASSGIGPAIARMTARDPTGRLHAFVQSRKAQACRPGGARRPL